MVQGKGFKLICENDVSFNKRPIKRVGRFRRRHLEISWNQVITDHCDVKMIIFMVNQSKIDKFISSFSQGTELWK